MSQDESGKHDHGQIAGRPGLDSHTQSPVEPSFVQDPYPFYQKARQSGDLFLWTDYDRISAVSHRAVGKFLRDRRWGREIPAEFRSDAPDHLEPFMRLERNSMLELDPPDHTRLRGLVNRAFTSRRINGLEPMISEISEQLVTGHNGQPFELQKSFAERLPVMVIARLLGVPEDTCDQLLSWSHDMVAMYQANRDHEAELGAAKAAAEFTEFMNGQIEIKRSAPANDLVTDLIAVEDEQGKLTRDEMISTCILLLNAGHEATAFAIGNGIKAIIESGLDPAEILAPGNRESTVEEILRFDPPLHIFERYAKEDMELFGQGFCRGDMVAVLLAAANRDPEVFEQPDDFIPARTGAGHTSFGAGIHFCVGAPLARLEMAAGLATLFNIHPDLRLEDTPRYADRYHFHGLEELWVTSNR